MDKLKNMSQELKPSVLNYLIKQPLFRERANKDRGIVNLLCMKNPLLKQVDKKYLVELVREYTTMDRAWRQILEKERIDLRGSDYENKEILEQEKQLDLGYEVGYNEDIKNGKNRNN